jgi:hypothetical protein
MAESPPAVIWRAEAPPAGASGTDAMFFKIIRGDGFESSVLRHTHDVYAALAAVFSSPAPAGEDEHPSAVVDAKLLFGAGELCVLMPWVGGRDALLADLSEGGCAVEPIARAIIWLAQRGVLYVDLRPANVRIVASDAPSADRAVTGTPEKPTVVKLVDYDDCVLVDPPATSRDLVSLLVTHGAPFAAPLGSPGALPAVLSAIQALWR